MKNGWMIRAGGGGVFVEDFRKKSAIAIGWNELGNLTQYSDHKALKQAYQQTWPNHKPGAVPNALAMIRKFRDEIQRGDLVISYDPESRQYLLGEDLGEYAYLGEEALLVGDYAQTRKVKWLGEVSRDLLSPQTRNSLGSTLTLFSLSESVLNELLDAFDGKPVKKTETDDVATALIDFKNEAVSQSHELIKDKIQMLDAGEMEHLAAALLRGMGYQTRVSPRGADRGVDVIASPDGLGLMHPRIKVEVKHRKDRISAPELRSFIGSLRDGDNGMYLSTGGFTQEARYEAERATLPVTLVDIDYLTDLIVTHYEQFDPEGRSLIPLVKVYWPAE